MELPVRQRLESPEMLSWIAERVAGGGELSRYRLAREVCERLDWRDGRGRLKEMACRKRLLQLARRWGCRPSGVSLPGAAVSKYRPWRPRR